VVEQDLSLDELTDRLNQALAARGLEPVKPRTMYRYVEKGLLPSGGRGPGAGYPESSVHTLVFVKELQAKTRLSLDAIAVIVKRLPPRVIEAVATGREPLEVVDLGEWVVDSLTPPRSAGASVSHVASSRLEFSAGELTTGEFAGGRYARLGRFGAAPDRPATPMAALSQLGDPKRAIAGDRERRWTSVEVTPNLAISARGLGEGEVNMLEAVAQWLRQFVTARG
jgi:hypothetical protein